MELLYDKKRLSKDTYTYRINRGGEFYVQEYGPVIITFENGKFLVVEFNLGNPYTRNGWRILAAINEEIAQIEKEWQAQEQEASDD